MKTFKPLLTLAISHDIHLTADQRKRLAVGDSVAAVGVSVPVWYAKGKTSEPAKEVFCNYILHNHPEAGDQVHLKMDGYEFNVPQLPVDFKMPEEISNEDWAGLEPEEREAISEERYVPLNGRNLLDIAEGGSEKLSFTRSNRARMRGVPTIIYHTIRISDVQDLKNSLI